MRKFLSIFMSMLMLVAFNISCDDAEEVLDDVTEEETVVVLAVNTETIYIGSAAESVGSLRFATNQEFETAVMTLENDSLFSVRREGALVYVTALSENRDLVNSVTTNMTLRVGEEGNTASALIKIEQVAETIADLSASCGDTISLANPAESYEVFEVATNQLYSTLKVSVDDTLNYKVEVDSLTVTVTALNENLSLVDTLPTLINLYVGDSINSYTKTIELTQEVADSAKLSIDGDVVNLDFDFYEGAEHTFTIKTNQDVEDVSVAIDNTEDFAISLDTATMVVTVTTVGENKTGFGNVPKTGIITVNAGYDYELESNRADEISIAVSQEDYLFELAVNEANITLDNETNATSTNTIVTNQEASTVKVAIDDETNFKVELDETATTITVTALNVNTTELDRTATVTVSAGRGYAGEDPVAFTVTQNNAISLTTDISVISLGKDADGTATINATTNLDAISAQVSDETNFKVEVDGMKVTVTALTANSGSSRSATVTITAGSVNSTVTVWQDGSSAAVYDYFAGGIVYEVGDGYAMVFSLEEEWLTICDSAAEAGGSGVDAVAVATDQNDGTANTAAIMALDCYSETTFPAVYWAVSQGEDWYLPSNGELKNLLEVVLGANDGTDGLDVAMTNAITSVGGDVFLADGSWYGSSAFQTYAKARYYKYNAAEGVADGTLKSGSYNPASPRHIRAIKKVTLD